MTCDHPDPVLRPDCASCRARVERDAEVSERDHLEYSRRNAACWDAARRQTSLDLRVYGSAAIVVDDPHAATARSIIGDWSTSDPTPEDLESERDAPRPGVWAGQFGADLRALTQDETDALVRFELLDRSTPAERSEIAAAVGLLPSVSSPQWPCGNLALCQRGGVDSDPLVRVLARRAWGDRDRQWFDLRGVRAGEGVRLYPMYVVTWAEVADRLCVSTTPDDPDCVGVALADARPGELVDVRRAYGVVAQHRVGARLRHAASDLGLGDDRIMSDQQTRVVEQTRRALEIAMTTSGRLARLAPAIAEPSVPPWARARRGKTPRPGR